MGVGPLSLSEHLFWFAVLSLACFLVYSGLREESVAAAARLGLRRWVRFLFGVALLALVSTGILSNVL